VATTKLLTLPQGDPNRKSFQNIASASERGGRTVGRLLSFARRAPAEDTELDLNALVSEQVSLVAETVPPPVRIETFLDPQRPRVFGDKSSLIQAPANLCSNALDAMGESGILTIRTLAAGEWAEVQIRDTGTGMTDEVRERALDSFFTTKSAGKGTGLGLSLVYRTVQVHRGRMEIHSEAGQGTVVTLQFPVRADLGNPEGPPSIPAGAAPIPRLVLVVDDDEMIRDSRKELLEAMGHTAVLASGESRLCGDSRRAPRLTS